MAKSAVVVSRQWHAPQIAVGVTTDGITVQMAMDDFLRALVSEAGSPALTLTTAQQLAKLTQAAERVVAGMKQATAQVM